MKKRLTRIRRSIQGLAGVHHRLEELNQDQPDERLVEAMRLMRAAYQQIYPVKREEQMKKNDGPTMRDWFAAWALTDPDEREQKHNDATIDQS